ncbi:hypothetical protein ACFHWS_19735 [Micromonospora sp. LOL_013]|uniref:hypothetical protein n=1 Tax=unclassified Micromonospora TaxID=2617518 RepID=UPI003A878D2A
MISLYKVGLWADEGTVIVVKSARDSHGGSLAHRHPCSSTAMQRTASVIDLSLAAQREIVTADPSILIRLPGPVLVDEWQRLPEVWDHV